MTENRLIDEIDALDAAIYGAVAKTPTPWLDEPLRSISEAANYSRPWVGAAMIMALFGGSKGRRAATVGLLAVGVSSALVNQGIKRVYRRGRPDRAHHDVPERRHVDMPGSTSFPSGHSASGFAFATAVAAYFPWLAIPLRLGAAVVAYSRVHTGVHYPSDAVVGSLVGGAVGAAVSYVAKRDFGTG